MPNVIMNADDALEMAVDEDVGSVHSQAPLMDVTHMLRKKMPTRKDHKKKAAEKVSKFVAQGVTDTIALQEDLENRLQI